MNQVLLPTELLSVMQFLVLESIYGTSLRYLPSCSQINQHKHFNYFSRGYCNACLFGSYPTTWCDVDLNHTWLSRLSSSKLPVSTNYLTAIAFTHFATHQQGESQIWTGGHRFAVCCLLPLGYFAIYNSRSVTVILKLLLSLHFVQIHADFLYRLRLTLIACRKLAPTSWIEHEQHFCWIA